MRNEPARNACIDDDSAQLPVPYIFGKKNPSRWQQQGILWVTMDKPLYTVDCLQHSMIVQPATYTNLAVELLQRTGISFLCQQAQ